MENNDSKDLIVDLYGNNLLGQLRGGTNETLAETIDKFMELQDEDSYYKVIDALKTRIMQGAHIVIPGSKTPENKFIFSTWRHTGEEGEWFIGFTGRHRRDIKAGRDVLQIPLEQFMKLVVDQKLNGIVFNPVDGYGFMLRRNVIAFILNS